MIDLADILKVILGSFRIGGLLIAMPLFGASPFPPQLKFFFAVSLAFMASRFFPPLSSALWENNGVILLVTARELCLGLFMGFGIKLIFLVMSMSLEFMGLQMGFGVASLFDPQTSSQVSVLGQLGVVLMILFFLSANLHHDLFYTLIRSYEKIPIGFPDWDFSKMIQNIVFSLKEAFEVSLRLSFPILFAMLTIHVIQAVIARTAPQMNLFFNVTFMVNIVAGLFLLSLQWPQIFSEVDRFARGLAKTGYQLW